MDPVDCAQDLVEACRGRGVDILFSTDVVSIDTQAGSVSGVTLGSGDTVACPTAVNAAGPWCNALLAEAGVSLPWTLVPTRIQMAHLDRPEKLKGDIPVMVDMAAGIYLRTQNRGQQLVVGSVLDALARIMDGTCRRAFVPIAGLHHATRDSAAGFCVFNDCGVAIETLRQIYGLQRVAYVDIDAHHGDGVFYSFEADPDLAFADLHEDGRYLYPGTGGAEETGSGAGHGMKLNLPMDMQAGDEAFFAAWDRAEAFVDAHAPEFILLQCGADSIAGDPITHLQYTPAAHAHAARRLCALADRHCQGRLLALGGGGYNRDNLARAWTAVLAELAGAGQ